MVIFCQRLVGDSRFQNFITFVILLAGLLVGIETYPAAEEKAGTLLHFLDQIVLWIFVAEIVVKMIAQWPRPQRFFLDSWNCFDFVIVAGAFVPFAGQYAMVLRLLRLLRVLRLVRALPKLQLLVGALLKSIPSMAYVSVLLFLLFYIYAVAAVFIWGANDPVHFSDLQTSFLSLFRIATLEDWTDVMYINMYGCDSYGYSSMADQCTASSGSPIGSAAFFVSFVLFGTMVILNLFIGVILNGMDEAQRETEELERLRGGDVRTLDSEIDDLDRQLEEMQSKLASLRRVARRVNHPTSD